MCVMCDVCTPCMSLSLGVGWSWVCVCVMCVVCTSCMSLSLGSASCMTNIATPLRQSGIDELAGPQYRREVLLPCLCDPASQTVTHNEDGTISVALAALRETGRKKDRAAKSVLSFTGSSPPSSHK
jgi:hypothetical protein